MGFFTRQHILDGIKGLRALAHQRRQQADLFPDDPVWRATNLSEARRLENDALDYAARLGALIREEEASSIVREYDPETTAPDPGCLECTLGTTPIERETGPCPYHMARTVLAKAAGRAA